MGWKSALGVGFAATVGYYLLPAGMSQSLASLGFGIAAMLIIVVTTRRLRPEDAAGWRLLAVSFGLFNCGDMAYDAYGYLLHRAVPFPSLADVFYLAGYPPLVMAVVSIGRSRGGRRSRESLIDAAIVSTGAAALFWQCLMRSYVGDRSMTWVGKLVEMAYPMMDLGVVFIASAAIMTGGRRRPVTWLLAAGLLSMLIYDFGFDLITLHALYTSPNPIDAFLLLGDVLLAVAALQQRTADPSSRARRATVAVSRARMAALTVACAISPTLLLVSSVIGAPVDVPVLAAITLILSALVTIRVGWLVRGMQEQARLVAQQKASLEAAMAEQQSLQADLRHQAFHDALTGLANRALLHDRISAALENSAHTDGLVSLFFCDLDGFKAVNDNLGHYAGDELLKVFSRRLLAVVRSGDTVARLGGDEFAILIANLANARLAEEFAERIVTSIRQPVELFGDVVSASVSVGIAFADDQSTTQRLLTNADIAMYEAKTSGKDQYRIFQKTMRAGVDVT